MIVWWREARARVGVHAGNQWRQHQRKYHQEFGQILLRPRELMSAVVRGHERHRSVTTLYWARNASLARVGTHEVIQPGIDRTSWCDLVNDAQVVGPGVSQSQDQFHLILDPQVDNNLVYQVCAKYELVSYL